MSYEVIDNGETVIPGGARTKKDYQELGILNDIRRQAYKLAKVDFPQIHKEFRVSVACDYYDKYRKPNQRGVCQIDEKVSVAS